MTTKDKQAIQFHLALIEIKIPTGQTVKSCLIAALQEARYITGRNAQTGLPDDTIQHGYLGRWTGAMCYMTMLDQIGTCYKPKNQTRLSSGSTIIKALKYFTNKLSDDEIDAIYALRNAFFHDFSLYNHNPSKPKLQHIFTVGNHPTEKVVKLPQRQWDGKMSSRAVDNNTFINLKTLGDLVEEIYWTLLDIDSKDELEIELQGGPDELVNRYTMVY
jgi:hypothetical protein